MEAGRFGLGRNRSLIEWNAVTSGDDGTPIWSRNDERWDTPSPSQICRNAALAKDPSQKLLWRFLTPTQITSETFQPEKLALKIVTAGKRRWDLIRHFYGNEVGESLGSRRVEADEFTIERCDLQPWAARRFSGRQKRRMTVQGQVGEVEISGPWGDVGDWLHAVPVIHLGKKTSFGFGRVEWEILT